MALMKSAPYCAAVGLAQLDAGDLGQRVPLVGRLERAGQQIVLADRLRAVARVDAGGAEEQELAHAHGVGGADQVELDQQVVGEEVDRAGGVGEDAADPGGGDDHDLGRLALHPGLDVGLAGRGRARRGRR